LPGSTSLLPQYESPRGFHILLEIDHPADAERIFQALADNGTVAIPMQKTFFAARSGALVDQFGILGGQLRSLNAERISETAAQCRSAECLKIVRHRLGGECSLFFYRRCDQVLPTVNSLICFGHRRVLFPRCWMLVSRNSIIATGQLRRRRKPLQAAGRDRRQHI